MLLCDTKFRKHSNASVTILRKLLKRFQFILSCYSLRIEISSPLFPSRNLLLMLFLANVLPNSVFLPLNKLHGLWIFINYFPSLLFINFYTHIYSYVERLLDRISNGKLAEDRRAAMTELQSVVSESQAAQLAFGAMGKLFPRFWRHLDCFSRTI